MSNWESQQKLSECKQMELVQYNVQRAVLGYIQRNNSAVTLDIIVNI